MSGTEIASRRKEEGEGKTLVQDALEMAYSRTRSSVNGPEQASQPILVPLERHRRLHH